MDLKEWDQKVGPFLAEIREHASWIAPHALRLGIAARNLPVAPDFETRAEDELAKAENVLESALNVVREARLRFVGLRATTPSPAWVASETAAHMQAAE